MWPRQIPGIDIQVYFMMKARKMSKVRGEKMRGRVVLLDATTLRYMGIASWQGKSHGGGL